MKKMLEVALNGTNENPYCRYGLTQNPFPQIAEAGVADKCRIVQSLGGEPIPNTDYIREKLKDFNPEFIELCCKLFKPGEMVKFTVFWEE